MLSSTDVPIVLCNRRVNGLDFPLYPPTTSGGYIATRHLIQRLPASHTCPPSIPGKLDRYQYLPRYGRRAWSPMSASCGC